MMSVERCFVLVIEGSVLKVVLTLELHKSPFIIEFEVWHLNKLKGLIDFLTHF